LSCFGVPGNISALVRTGFVTLMEQGTQNWRNYEISLNLVVSKYIKTLNVTEAWVTLAVNAIIELVNATVAPFLC
jgi:hypothetical protein